MNIIFLTIGALNVGVFMFGKEIIETMNQDDK
jgi:hypothetical protein